MEPFEDPTYWNEFYEKAWNLRRLLLKKMIDAGERHPLRLIGAFESIMRFSTIGSSLAELDYDIDAKLPEAPISNVVRPPVGPVTIGELSSLPTGFPFSINSSYFSSKMKFPSLGDVGIVPLLIDFLRWQKFDAVVELGSGLSSNLVKLYYNGGPKIPYYAGEFTASGTAAAEMLGTLDSDFNMTAFRFDYRAPDFSAISEKGRVFVFTCHSIEQVASIRTSFFRKLVNAADHITCMHFEPFGFQLGEMAGNKSEVDVEQEKFLASKEWNMNLLKTLMRASDSGLIDLRYLAKNAILSRHDANPTSLAMWQSPESA